MTTLRIAGDLALPIDAVTQAMAILARRGAGKTYTGSVIVEEAIGAGMPVVVLDPTGAWWGLRSSVDGERPGLPVVIFGGDHGDVPLEPTAGAVLADVVLEHPGAYVLDLSGLLSKAAEQRFAADFLERLYRAKKRETGPLLVVVDEADVFAPQRPGPEQTRTLGALESIVRRGRIKGLGCLLITQRAAVLNKNVLTQTEVLIVMQTTGPQDRAAIDAWIEGNGTADERAQVMGSLASLERGEAWVWSPSFLRILQRVRIRARKTFDSSRTPEPGETAIAPVAFARVDLEKLGARIAATIEKQKADDPKELRRHIATLERQIATKPTELVEKVVEKVVEVPVLNGNLDRLEGVVRDLVGAGKDFAAVGAAVVGAADLVATAIQSVKGGPSHEPRQPVRAAQPVQKAPVARSERPIERQHITITDADVRLGKGEHKVLDVLAEYPDGRTYNELAFLAGYSAKASTLGVILSKLRQVGLIEPGNQPVRATDAGLEAAGGVRERPTGQALLSQWLRHPRMGEGERRVLLTLIDAYPDELTHQELCERTGYSPVASTIGVILSKLRKLGLVEQGRRLLAGEFHHAIAERQA